MWLTVTLPSWLDADRLRWVTLVAIAVLVILGLGIVRFVQRMLTMLLALGLVGGLVVALWVQRDDLKDCQATCSCRLFGQEVQVPPGRLCGDTAILQSDS